MSLFLSALSAGLIIGFAAMAVAFACVCTQNIENEYIRRLAIALVYPLGFIIVVMSSAQLFTEHTSLAVYPFLDKRIGFLKLHKIWAIVLTGNLSGTLISSFLLFLAEPVIQIKLGHIYMAQHLLEFSWWQIVISAILAGWLMSLGGWLLLSTPTSTAQIICVYIVTFLIGIGGLHHSIAGSAEVFTAFILKKNLGLEQVFRFLSASVLGNLFGGSFFVATLNYTYIRTTESKLPSNNNFH